MDKRRPALAQDLSVAEVVPSNVGKPKKRKIVLIIVSIVVGLFVLAGVGGVVWYNQNLQPPEKCCAPDPDDSGSYAFDVKSGDTLSDIAKRLEDEQYIRNSTAFLLYAKLHGKGTNISAGKYKFGATAISVPKVIEVLEAGPSVDVFTIMFLPGGTLADAKKALEKVGYSGDEIDAAFTKNYSHPVLAGKPAGADLEGYIFGETYEFYKGTPVEKIVEISLDELYKVVQKDDLVAKFQQQGFNLYQGIVLSSIVQREGGNDLPGVARVFLNRLQIGMNLGSDVTYQYIADKLGVERTPYLDNPYNTRLYPGLPPGPISSPGAKALQAVANPSDNDYLFFLSGDDDVTYFARTDAEHQRNIREHCQEKCLIL